MDRSNPTKLNSVKDRLLFYINHVNLSPGRFEKMTNLSNGYIHNIVNTISDKTFENKIKPVFPELNKLWILHGEEPMILKNVEYSKLIPQPEIDIKDMPHAQQMEVLLNKIKGLENQIKEERKENAENTQKIIEFVDEYLRPVFDYMQESIENKKKDNKA